MIAKDLFYAEIFSAYEMRILRDQEAFAMGYLWGVLNPDVQPSLRARACLFSGRVDRLAMPWCFQSAYGSIPGQQSRCSKTDKADA
jgi:hypothetical protein